MRRGCVAVAVALTSVLAPAGADAERRDVRIVAQLDEASKARGLDVVLDLPAIDTVVVEAAPSSVSSTIARLRAAGATRVQIDPQVEAAEVVDDPLWPQQWGPRLVGVERAWDRTAGAAATRIAVLDTGVSEHRDLDGAVVDGVDIENEDGDATDDNGHGTRVAGIIAARRDNAEGIAGYCGKCSLLAVKVLDAEGLGDSSVVAAGIVWAVEHGAAVVNLSLSSPSASFALGDAVAYAAEHDVVVVAAGGNDGLLQPTYPAAYPGVVGVVASDPGDRLYRWTNHGAWASVAAPGCHRTLDGDGYTDLCGTSSAAPAVAGVAGLMRSAAPDATAERVRAVLAEVGAPVDGRSVRRLRADAAVAEVLRDDDLVSVDGATTPGAPSAPRGVRVASHDGDVEVSWTEPDDIGSSPIVDYVVTTSPGAERLVVPGERRSATLRGLLDGVTYRFSVLARNDAGDGPSSTLSPPMTPTADGLARVGGSSRVLTSIALSQRVFARAGTVVIARADDYADALAAAPLAAELGGPLLLSAGDAIAPEVGAELQRLGTHFVHLIGGQGALSQNLEASLAWWGVTNVVRTAGSDRFETAARIAAQVGGTAVYVANGYTGWPDAVAASGLAAVQGRPIVLVAHDRVPRATREILAGLSIDAATVVGGTGTISDQVMQLLGDPGGDGVAEIAVSRVAGADRYETSRRIADLAVTAGADPSRAWLANGREWPDALATGPAAAARGGVLLLIRGDDLDSSPGAARWLDEHAATLEEIVLVGGRASISDGAEAQVMRRLDWA
jgi:subtilisin family serine protease/putative cell wall-binding protein